MGGRKIFFKSLDGDGGMRHECWLYRSGLAESSSHCKPGSDTCKIEVSSRFTPSHADKVNC